MSALLELAARCEAANETQEATLLCEAFEQIHGWLPRNIPARDMPKGALKRQAKFTRLMDAGASLDAAMTLVPEGWHWQIGIFNLDGKGRAQLAEQVETEFGTAIGVRQNITAATPALALCAAALRARAANTGSDSE